MLVYYPSLRIVSCLFEVFTPEEQKLHTEMRDPVKMDFVLKVNIFFFCIEKSYPSLIILL